VGEAASSPTPEARASTCHEVRVPKKRGLGTNSSSSCEDEQARKGLVRRGVAPPNSRFPPPWTVQKIPGGLVVRDANGQSLAYVYSGENEADASEDERISRTDAPYLEFAALL
jgi:hypothetical protein